VLRRIAALATTLLLTISCGQGSSTATAHSPSPAVPKTPNSTGLSGIYGLLLSSGKLELVSPNGAIASSTAVAPPSVQFCASGMGAVVQPPVSASDHQVYIRDGDTKIRSVGVSSASDVTTVPGSPTMISFFSVSPDDQRIAVVVEDLSPANTINLRLYVEDLHGGGHHLDIYTTTTPKGKGAYTLWPMGWHLGKLVLALVVACTFEPAGLSPIEWHVSDATTAARQATIGGNCVLSYWPSPAGVACVDQTKLQASTYDWTGNVLNTIAAQADDYQSGLSPSGKGVFLATGSGIGAPTPATRVVGAGVAVSVPGHAACLWIDEGHLLAPDAVIAVPSGVVTPLAATGMCAGRFPGGL
jgi:hypothetical protein